MVESRDEKLSILRIGLKHVDVVEYCRQDEFLWRSALLSTLDDDEKRQLLAGARVRGLNPGEQLDSADSTGYLAFVLEGSLVLAADDLTDLGTLGQGDFFNLSSVLDDAVLATATADNQVKLALLPAAHIRRLLDSRPVFGGVLRELATARKKAAEDGADFLNRW